MAPLLTLLLLGFLLRAHQIEQRPLHFDEGLNAYFAPLSLPALLDAHIANGDTDPPAHRIALGLWQLGGGLTPLSLRLFSALCSLISVALTVALARHLRLSAPAQLLAVLGMACSPMAIDYGQEAKGYAFEGAMAMIAWLAWMQITARRSSTSFGPARDDIPAPGAGMSSRAGFRQTIAPWHVAAYVISLALLLATHFYSAPVVLMQWAWHLLVNVRRDWRAHLRPGLRLIALQALAAIPVGIWCVLAFPAIVSGSLGMSSSQASASPLSVIMQIFGEFAIGRAAPDGVQWVAAAVLLIATLAGAAQLWRGNRTAFWFGACALLAITFAVLLQMRITFFKPRFLLYLLPQILVLVTGLRLTQRDGTPERSNAPALRTGALLRSGLLACVGLCSVAGVVVHHTAAIDSANDFRPLFAQMQRAVKPNDAALGTYLWMPGMVNSYAPELTPQLRWYVDDVTPENERARLTPIVANHNTIWVFNFLRDPDAAQTTAVAGLKRRAWSVDRATAGNMSVLQFSQASTPTSAPAQVVVFADVIELSTWTMHEHAGGAALNGEPWGLPLAWRALRPISEDLAVFMHVRDCAGNLRAQQDSDLINGLRPLFTLSAGERVTETRFVVVPFMQWDGPLNFDVGVYRRSDGTRLRTREGKDAVRVPSLADCG